MDTDARRPDWNGLLRPAAVTAHTTACSNMPCFAQKCGFTELEGMDVVTLNVAMCCDCWGITELETTAWNLFSEQGQRGGQKDHSASSASLCLLLNSKPSRSLIPSLSMLIE